MTSESKLAFLRAIERDHGRQLRRFLALRMRNAAPDIPDLVQEIYLRLLRIGRHDTIRNPQAYLYTVASHVLHQHALRARVTPESVDITDVLQEIQSTPDSDPQLQAELEQRFESLRRGLRAHSPRAYATLMLHKVHGLPLQEISRRLGVTYSMTKKYLARALRYIEKELEREGETP